LRVAQHYRVLLPRPEIEIRALVPYERGDLVNRIHQTGESGHKHRADGTLVAARVSLLLPLNLPHMSW
jgi:hypothetical protein